MAMGSQANTPCRPERRRSGILSRNFSLSPPISSSAWRPTFPAIRQGSNIGTLFPNTNETTLINDLVTDSNFGDLFDFSNGDAVSGPNGSIAFGSTDTFSEIAFSTGQIIGTGVSVITQGPPAAGAVPEPAAWVMMIVGFGLTGGLARRRRGAMAATA
jgi:hypothetical protein